MSAMPSLTPVNVSRAVDCFRECESDGSSRLRDATKARLTRVCLTVSGPTRPVPEARARATCDERIRRYRASICMPGACLKYLESRSLTIGAQVRVIVASIAPTLSYGVVVAHHLGCLFS